AREGAEAKSRNARLGELALRLGHRFPAERLDHLRPVEQPRQFAAGRPGAGVRVLDGFIETPATVRPADDGGRDSHLLGRPREEEREGISQEAGYPSHDSILGTTRARVRA